MKQIFRIELKNPDHDKVHTRAVQAVNDAEGDFQVTIGEIKRSNDQSAKFHAICNDIAKCVPWAGVKLDGEAFKRLLVDAWARETGRRQGEVVPSLDGSSVVILGIQTRSMAKKDMAELIEFALAWGTDNNVKFNSFAKDPW